MNIWVLLNWTHPLSLPKYIYSEVFPHRTETKLQKHVTCGLRFIRVWKCLKELTNQLYEIKDLTNVWSAIWNGRKMKPTQDSQPRRRSLLLIFQLCSRHKERCRTLFCQIVSLGSRTHFKDHDVFPKRTEEFHRSHQIRFQGFSKEDLPGWAEQQIRERSSRDLERVAVVRAVICAAWLPGDIITPGDMWPSRRNGIPYSTQTESLEAPRALCSRWDETMCHLCSLSCIALIKCEQVSFFFFFTIWGNV